MTGDTARPYPVGARLLCLCGVVLSEYTVREYSPSGKFVRLDHEWTSAAALAERVREVLAPEPVTYSMR